MILPPFLKHRKFRFFFTKLQELVPSKFEIKQTSDKWFEKGFGSSGVEGTGVSSTASRPSLILNPDLRGSWLDPAEKAAPADLVGYWPSHFNIPPPPLNVLPLTFPQLIPTGLRILLIPINSSKYCWKLKSLRSWPSTPLLLSHALKTLPLARW